ncbi:MAG: cysteinyl-tRNA synthetase [Chloroflexota bacterium]|nr:cysteinyl-tRNA synthetase [Chloroflexota bacterium]
MTLRIANTLTGREEEFQPLGDPVRMYLCGMTPKFHPHIGHARLFVAVDLIRRTLEHRGYRVRYVQNFTDIDDKIIDRSKQEGASAEEVAKRYTDSYFESMALLGVKAADEYPSVTRYMSQIIAYVQSLVDRGYAYDVDGDVYFAVDRFPDYGKLSGRTEESGMTGVRVELEAGKRDPRDFALWKSAKPGEPAWDSPWGPGRPGWHIECSTMVRETLGDQIDIHCGGQDLIFPHHENEIAQSESFTGCVPFARYWAHIGLVTTGSEKMAHSLMNFTTVKDMLEKYEPAAVRTYLLQTHYRSPMVFSEEGLVNATRSLRALRMAYGESDAATLPAESSAAAQGLLDRFDALLEDDFNSPGALGVVFDTTHEINRIAGAGGEGAALRGALRTMIDVLGIPLAGGAPPAQATDAAPFIDLLVATRAGLRAERQWALADRVRDGLKELGVTIEDSPTGTTWRLES